MRRLSAALIILGVLAMEAAGTLALASEHDATTMGVLAFAGFMLFIDGIILSFVEAY